MQLGMVKPIVNGHSLLVLVFVKRDLGRDDSQRALQNYHQTPKPMS